MALLGGMVTVFILHFGGEIEGRIAPVMDPLSLHAPIQMREGAMFRGEAHKNRNCDFVGIEWFLGPRDGRRVQVDARFTDKPQVRGEGLLEWSGIVVDLRANTVMRNSHADVLHQCHTLGIPHPWQTRTAFFDGDAE